MLDKEEVKRLLLRRRWIKDGHWLWLGGIGRDNYGHTNIDGNTYAIHRLSAYVFLGLDLSDKSILVLHKIQCTEKHCFNPEHLYIGNYASNNNDTVKSGHSYNASKTHCHKGHEYTENNTYWYYGLSGWRRDCLTCRRARSNNRVKGVKSVGI